MYQNLGQGHITFGITSPDRFYNLPLMKHFVTLFSRTVKVTKLKPGIHMDSGLMYHINQNQSQGPITHSVKSLHRFYVAMLPCPTSDVIW